MTAWPTESNWPAVTSVQTLPSTVQNPAYFCKRPQFSPGKCGESDFPAKFSNPNPQLLWEKTWGKLLQNHLTILISALQHRSESKRNIWAMKKTPGCLYRVYRGFPTTQLNWDYNNKKHVFCPCLIWHPIISHKHRMASRGIPSKKSRLQGVVPPWRRW